ncbi:MAG: hypothetical protein SFT81_04075 [Candidatus Caenarcaniphilales bacterium]|nr:hypothetical protein [Candidatus Caenarcaniphilales bacterium]
MKSLSKIYLLHGEDPYRLKLALNELKQTNPKAHFFKVDSAGDLRAEVFGLSLFGSNRFLMIDLAEIETERVETLITDLAELEPEAEKVIFYKQGKLDRRLKFVKQLEKIAQVKIIEAFKPWDHDKAVNWIKKDLLPNLPLRIGDKALKRLCEFTQNDSLLIVNELERLICFKSEGEITLAEIEQISTCESSLDELIESLIRQDFAFFLARLKKHESIFPTIAGLQTSFRYLVLLKSLASLPGNEIASLIGKHPYKVGLDLERISKVSFTYLQKILFTLNKIEYSLKSGEFFEEEIGVNLAFLRELVLR